MSHSEWAQYRRHVSGGSAQAWSEGDDVRRWVPVFSLAVGILAVVLDPSSATDVIFAAIPVAAFAFWAYVREVPLLGLTIAVVVPVVAAQRLGKLEPLMFDASVLGFVVGRWSRTLLTAAALGLLVTASPVAAAVIQDPSELAVGIWILGIVFPWLIGRAAARQLQLAAQLDATRRELAQQALLAERRGIARDVHDLVGHGLAAVMLQVTSARHVLRRDPASAEEALRSAEDVGRRSMEDLRRTVALLRSDEDTDVAAPLPSAGEIGALVDHARAAGLDVELRVRGDIGRIPPSVGVALYRIAQEGLANAARHAPRAQTLLELELADGRVALEVHSRGPAATVPADGPRPGFGLIGMRERATALGGEFAAGPTPDGWRVRCSLPLAAGAERVGGEPRT
jgi:signal transduction histidine kinase